MWNPLPLLAGVKTYLIVGAVTGAVAFAGGAYSGWRWEHGAVLQARLDAAALASKAKELAAKDQAAQDAVKLKAAVAEALFQGRLEGRISLIVQETPVYVTAAQDAIVCIPVGLARVLRAAAEGRSPGSLSLAPGQSDDDCSDITATEMARWFTAYAGASLGNAHQLNSLEAEINEHAKVRSGEQPR